MNISIISTIDDFKDEVYDEKEKLEMAESLED